MGTSTAIFNQVTWKRGFLTLSLDVLIWSEFLFPPEAAAQETVALEILDVIEAFTTIWVNFKISKSERIA